jgi:hypothetical protein
VSCSCFLTTIVGLLRWELTGHGDVTDGLAVRYEMLTKLPYRVQLDATDRMALRSVDLADLRAFAANSEI